MTLLRIFPRKTKATPNDENVRFGPPTLFDKADEIHVSVSFTWDKPKAERMADEWSMITKNIKIGGPAYDDPGGDFIPGQYLKEGYVITSRGCPNHCWFCSAWKREGDIRELPITKGWNILDSNLLACSRSHIEQVFEMLSRQPKRPLFTGGLEARLLEEWHIDWLLRLGAKTIWLAYDTPDDWEPVLHASELLRSAGMISHTKHDVRCYVLIGYPKDTVEDAEKRLRSVVGLDIMPMAMLYDHGEHRSGDRNEWIKFAREWASPWIVGLRMRK